MSYNPAFVLDESPLSMTRDDQGNGIKLTSFKIFEQNKSSLCPSINQQVTVVNQRNEDGSDEQQVDSNSTGGSDSAQSLATTSLNNSSSSTSVSSTNNNVLNRDNQRQQCQHQLNSTNNNDRAHHPVNNKKKITKNTKKKKKKSPAISNEQYTHPEQNDLSSNAHYQHHNLSNLNYNQETIVNSYRQPQNHSPTSQTSLITGAAANVNGDLEGATNNEIHNILINSATSQHHLLDQNHPSILKSLHTLDDFFINNNDATGLCAAVECRDMRYDVGRGSSQKTILYNINVTVPEGSIYGLLGPSGCGKTSMLRCVVGRIIPNEGSVRVFGYKPNDPGSSIPGPAIGYMPQEISVYEDFTIDETLRYFGKICRMKNELLDSRIEFLVRFLDLPEKTRMMSSLSGGQKRRVSLAAALVHSPPLLILDEPTVGVDPLLRQSIWKHLVTLAQTEKISVVITTHYIEEARQANIVGLMRHGKLLAEDSPENLMDQHGMNNLEDVFLKLCVSDSSRQAAKLANLGLPPMSVAPTPEIEPRFGKQIKMFNAQQLHHSNIMQQLDANGIPIKVANDGQRIVAKKPRSFPSVFAITKSTHDRDNNPTIVITGSQNSNQLDSNMSNNQTSTPPTSIVSQKYNFNNKLIPTGNDNGLSALNQHPSGSLADLAIKTPEDDYDFVVNKHNLKSMKPGQKYPPNEGSIHEWTSSLMAVVWKNYISIKRNPPVLVFEFILPAVQVILFCLCIGGDPFDVPVALVNDDPYGRASVSFLDSIDKKAIKLVHFIDTDSAIESVRRGENWGVIRIPGNYTRFLKERISIDPYEFNSEDSTTSELIKNGTISIYPDLTNLHLALAMENTFRMAFTKFANDSLEALGLDPALAELPIKVEQPIYGTLKRNGYLEFMAPGVVISITYVMATGLTALAFILEKRDGMLERSLIAGVSTSQILLAHAAVQVFVMTIQITLVLAFTFFVFDIPSNGPFVWVVLLILLQGCTGMAFGLLVSAICNEENTAVMMLVGTFYTNLILAGIIWPIEAMPHYLRWLSYMQPQTLPTETLRNILSRGWGIGEAGVQIGFAVTIGWLVVFLMVAGFVMQYMRG